MLEQDEAVRAGQAALLRAAWQEARVHFKAALARGETPEALEGFGTAAWWLSDASTVFAARERAYRLYRESGEDRCAARVASALAMDYCTFQGRAAIARGWVRRAEHLLSDEICRELGWLLIVKTHIALMIDHDPPTTRDFATRAGSLGEALSDVDLEMLALAYEGLALVSLGQVEAGMRCLELDSSDPDCHWLMGLIHLWRRDHAKSISCYERARAMNPNQPDLLADMADMFTYAGRSEEAIELATLACELNPNPPDWYYWNIAAGHFLLGRYEESLKHLQRMAQPGPAHRLFAATFAKLGRRDEAQRSAAALLEFTPDFSVRRYAAQAPYARQDDLNHYVSALRLAGLPD